MRSQQIVILSLRILQKNILAFALYALRRELKMLLHLHNQYTPQILWKDYKCQFTFIKASQDFKATIIFLMDYLKLSDITEYKEI